MFVFSWIWVYLLGNLGPLLALGTWVVWRSDKLAGKIQGRSALKIALPALLVVWVVWQLCVPGPDVPWPNDKFAMGLGLLKMAFVRHALILCAVIYVAGLELGIKGLKWVSYALILRLAIIFLFSSDTGYYPFGFIAGRVERVWFYFGDHHIMDGYTSSWDQLGRKTEEGYYSKDKKNGVFTVYGPMGEVIDRWLFSDDRPADGKRLAYFTSGKLRAETNYSGGQYNGRVFEQAENGVTLSDWNYLNGQPADGQKVDHFENGHVRTKVEYSGGKNEGIFEEWSQDGQMLKSRTTKNGLKNGIEYNFYKENGKKTYTVFLDGKLISGKEYQGDWLFSEVLETGEARDYRQDGSLWRSGYVHEKSAETNVQFWDSEGHRVLRAER